MGGAAVSVCACVLVSSFLTTRCLYVEVWDIKTYGTVTRVSTGPAPDAGEWWEKDTGLLRSTPGLGNWFGFYLMTTDWETIGLLCMYLGQKKDQLKGVVTYMLPVEMFATRIDKSNS